MPFATYAQHRAFLVAAYARGAFGYAYLLRLLASLRSQYGVQGNAH